MRKLFLAAAAVISLGTSAAFADSLTIGSANQAPVFANRSGNRTMISDDGNAANAPVYALTSGTSSLAIQSGSAHIAPVFGAVRGDGANFSSAN